MTIVGAPAQQSIAVSSQLTCEDHYFEINKALVRDAELMPCD